MADILEKNKLKYNFELTKFTTVMSLIKIIVTLIILQSKIEISGEIFYHISLLINRI